LSPTVLSHSLAARWPARVLVLLALSAAIMSICMGLRQSLGLFMRPMTLDLGITASAFSFSLAIQNIVWGASQPLVGMLADRYGARPVLVLSALLYAAGLAVMTELGGTLGLDIGGLFTGIAIAGAGFGVLMAVVSRAVPASQRSQAVGAVAAAGSLGTLCLAPIGQQLISGFGWRAALLVFALIALSMAVLALFLREHEAADAVSDAAAESEQTLGQALRAAATHGGYLAMTAAFFACGFQLVFITTHLPSFLALCGLPVSVGATALGLIGLCNTFGTYGVGLLGARYSQKRLLALVYLLRTLAIIVYIALPITATSTLVFGAAMGLLWLSVAPLVSGIIGRMFGLKHFSTLYGFVFFSHQLGSFCGALLGGFSFDLTGSYSLAWLSLVVIGLLAFALQWPMDDRPPAERRRELEAAGEAALA
jgi:predicted MFS family arabinose efflux permease